MRKDKVQKRKRKPDGGQTHVSAKFRKNPIKGRHQGQMTTSVRQGTVPSFQNCFTTAYFPFSLYPFSLRLLTEMSPNRKQIIGPSSCRKQRFRSFTIRISAKSSDQIPKTRRRCHHFYCNDWRHQRNRTLSVTKRQNFRPYENRFCISYASDIGQVDRT